MRVQVLCRFTRDLPPGLTEFNSTCLRQQQARATAQNRQAISHIMREAKRPSRQASHLPESGEDEEEELHDYMTDEVAEQDVLRTEQVAWGASGR